MNTYFDKILYLYPNIQGVSYWHTQYDGTPWNDPYDGIVWENKEIEKPSKEQLDTVLDFDLQTKLDQDVITTKILTKEEILTQLSELTEKVNLLTF